MGKPLLSRLQLGLCPIAFGQINKSDDYALAAFRSGRIGDGDAAARAWELAKNRYAEGDIDFLRVLDAERSRLDAEDALTRTAVDTNTDVVAIYKALGGAVND